MLQHAMLRTVDDDIDDHRPIPSTLSDTSRLHRDPGVSCTRLGIGGWSAVLYQTNQFPTDIRGHLTHHRQSSVGRFDLTGHAVLFSLSEGIRTSSVMPSVVSPSIDALVRSFVLSAGANQPISYAYAYSFTDLSRTDRRQAFVVLKLNPVPEDCGYISPLVACRLDSLSAKVIGIENLSKDVGGALIELACERLARTHDGTASSSISRRPA